METPDTPIQSATVWIQLENGKLEEVEVTLNQTLAQFKQLLARIFNIKPERQKLQFDECMLKDKEATLESIGLEEDSIIKLCSGSDVVVILVQLENETFIEVEISPNQTVSDLKECIEEKTGVKTMRQNLQYNECPLNDGNATIQSLELADDCIVQMKALPDVEIKLIIRLETGLFHEYKISTFADVPELKDKISSITNISVENQNLVHQRQDITHSRQTLQQLKMKNQSVVRVSAKQQSGTAASLQQAASSVQNSSSLVTPPSIPDHSDTANNTKGDSTEQESSTDMTTTEEKSKTIKLYFQYKQKPFVEVNISSETTVYDLKQLLARKIDVQPSRLLLQFNGNHLIQEDAAISFTGMENGSIVNLILLADISVPSPTSGILKEALHEPLKHSQSMTNNSLVSVKDSFPAQHHSSADNIGKGEVSPPPIKIHVRLDVYSCIEIDISPQKSVYHLKEIISEKAKWNVQEMKIIFKGKSLNRHDEIIETIGIQDKSVVDLLSIYTFKNKSFVSVRSALDKLKSLFPPKKLNIADVKFIGKNDDSVKLEGVRMIQNLLFCNYREALQLINNQNSGFLDDEMESTDLRKQVIERPHPLDMLLMMFYSSNDALRQTLMSKLALCQIAVPFILPSANITNGQRTYEVLTWAIESIVLSYGNKLKTSTPKVPATVQECIVDERVVDMKCHAVAFIRCGTTSFISKSHIASRLICNDDHPYFINRNVISRRNKFLSNGLVDVKWFLPRGDQQLDEYENNWMCLNLHGSLNIETLKFLRVFTRSSCNVLCFFLGDEYHTADNMKTMFHYIQDACGSIERIIWICTRRDVDVQIEAFRLSLSEYPELKQKSKLVNAANKLEAELLQFLQQHMKEAFHSQPPSFSLNKLAEECQKEESIAFDRDKFFLRAAKDNSVKVIQATSHGHSLSQIFPLQNEMPQIVQLQKKCHRWEGKDQQHSLDAYQSEQRKNIDKASTNLRNKAESFYRENQGFQAFLEGLFASKISDHSLFVIELRRQLNIRNKKTLSTLQTATSSGTGKVRSGSEKQQSPNPENKNNLVIEDFFREAAILADFNTGANSKTFFDTFIKDLVPVSIELLQNGFPIELMDGHSSNVCLNWLKRLFTEMDRCFCKGERVCVLSVLGIQSSGKSTMLNMLFGLNFGVSVGRCTRGIFIQLIPLSKELQKRVKCSHILLLDTEGLCSPETKNERTQDNELATFIVTLSNITLINIMGENLSELQDVLQIVAAALLRIRRATEKSGIKYDPHCLIVHQNMDAVESRERLEDTCRAIQQTLNKAAEVAFKMEGYPVSGNAKFSDIIEFDIMNKDHVCYVPHLFKGNAPMATISPAYVAKMNDLKETLFNLMESLQQNFLSLRFFQTKLADTREAILKENFVFSFKNSLEILAYQFISRHYVEWDWKIRNIRMEQENLAKINLKVSSYNIGAAKRDFQIAMQNIYQEVLTIDLHNAFSNVEFENIVRDWRQLYERRLEFLLQDQERIGNSFIEAIHNRREVQNALNEDKKKFSEYMKQEIQKLNISKAKNPQMTEEDKEKSEENIIQVFDEFWKGKMMDHRMRNPLKSVVEIDVAYLFDDLLKLHFGAESVVFSAYWQYMFHGRTEMVSNDNTRKTQNPIKFITNAIKSFFGRTEHQIEDFFASQSVAIERTLSDYEKKLQPVNDSIIKILIVQVETEFKNKGYDKYPSWLGWCFAEWRPVIIHFLQRIERRFIQETDPFLILEAEKPIYFTLFKDIMSEQELIVRVVNTLTQCVNTSLSLFHKEEGTRLLIDYVKKTFAVHMATTKQELIAHSLYTIGFWINKDSKHINYIQTYCLYPEKVLRSVLLSQMKKVCQEYEKNIQEHFKKIIATNVNGVLSLLKNSVPEGQMEIDVLNWMKAMQNSRGSSFMTNFTSKVKDLSGIATGIVNRAELIDRCEKMLEKEKNDLNIDIKSLTKPAIDILAETELVKGCPVKCPFCRAPCEYNKEHPKMDHKATQHRPTGVRGGYMRSTKKLVALSCNALVASNNYAFYLKPDCDDHIYYNKYRDKYPEWGIQPDATIERSKFWCWVLRTFNKQLADLYEKVEADIPDDWESIEWSDVIKTLESDASIPNSLNYIPDPLVL